MRRQASIPWWRRGMRMTAAVTESKGARLSRWPSWNSTSPAGRGNRPAREFRCVPHRLSVRDGRRPVPLPAVFGHEGAGIVVAVGADVTSVSAGGHVVLTFSACGTCRICARAIRLLRPLRGLRFAGGRAPMAALPLHREAGDVRGVFFGQSSSELTPWRPSATS